MSQSSVVSGRATVLVSVGADIGVQYHRTVVACKEGNQVTLKSGGWQTATTKLRMNQFSAQFCNRSYRVFQQKGDWFVSYRPHAITPAHSEVEWVTVPFTEGMVITVY